MIDASRNWFRAVMAALALGCIAIALLAAQGVFHKDSTPPPGDEEARHVVACQGYVDVDGGVIALDSLRPGRVEAVLIKENESVVAAASLVRLEDRLYRERLAEARAALAVARLILEQAQRRPEEHRLRRAQQASTLEAARQRVVAAKKLLAQRRQLFDKKLESAEKVAEAEARVAELEALAQTEEDRLAELKLLDPSQDVHRASVEVQLQAARVQQAETELKELTLQAPAAGMVLRVQVAPGDLVGGPGARRPMIYFCPARPRLVRVELDQEFAGAVRSGLSATVQDDAEGAPAWRGRVRRVADWFGPHRVVLDEPRPERGVRTVECEIEVEDGCPLRIGQRVRVRIDTAGVSP